MKLQHLAIIFIIIILPIAIVLANYIHTQIETIELQTRYNTKLQTATYDAIKAFQLNTLNNKYSSISDSKIRDIEASISTFYNSLGVELGSSNFEQEELMQYIPALVYTMYDGYYIYGKYYNSTQEEYQYGLRPYIYYSCRYKNHNSDFVVNYTLDNTITIYGIVNGNYITKTGSLVNPDLIDVQSEKLVIYDGTIEIKPEILQEQLIILNANRVPEKDEAEYYEYITYQNRKVYYDKQKNNYFWYTNNQKEVIQDTNTLLFANKWTYDGDLHSNSAIEYFKDAKEFSLWVKNNLSNITQQDAKDANGNTISDFAIKTNDQAIFDFSNKNDPFLDSSTFNENRISVIRRTIQTTLNAAIANYSSMANYEFVMPILSEEDWDRLVNNVSMVSFMQGIPIGSKYYNNYCIITNNNNKEVVQKDSIYIITNDGEEDLNKNEVHLASSKEVIDKEKTAKIGYRNIDFEVQSIVLAEDNEIYYYPHANYQCYDCMVNANSTYNIDDIIIGKIREYNNTSDTYIEKSAKNLQNVRTIYLTALARERYDLYDGVNLDKSITMYSTKPIITSVNTTTTTATIQALGEVNEIVGYAITENPIVPTIFTMTEHATDFRVTKSGLESEKTYYAWVIDSAGNMSESFEFRTKAIGNIEFAIEPNTWTNQNVWVSASISGQDYHIQTSKDALTWQDVVNQEFTENGTMYARIKERPDIQASTTITNIDKIKPEIISIAATTNSATITAKDEGGSGIASYAVTDSQTQPTTGFQTSATFNNLQLNTTYYAWVKDLAGNVSQYKTFQTNSNLTEALITFELNPSSWTNGNVLVTAHTSITGYILETSKNGIRWETTNYQTFDRNGIMYARLVDNTGQQLIPKAASIEITTIDKIKPTVTDVTATTNSASIRAKDDGGSGVSLYAITETANEPEVSKFQSSSTINNLKQNTTYYAWVMDKAGNISVNKQFTTKAITRLTITVQNPSTWQKSKTVTITAANNSYANIYYTTDGKVPTAKSTKYTKAFTVNTNCTITAVAVDNVNQPGETATNTVTKVDNKQPTINTALNATNVSGKAFTLNMTVTDANSGLSKIEWYYRLSTVSSYTKLTDTYTAMNGTATGATGRTSKTKTISNLNGGIYYAYAVVYDVAGNSTRSDTITITCHVHTTSCYHKHTDDCYRYCGGQLYTPFGSHYVHKCRVCGHEVWNSVWGWADIPATPGENCNQHYEGKCSARILECRKTENTLECGY